MDDYGSFTQIEKDWIELADALKRSGTVVFSWSHNKFDGFIVMVSVKFETLGIMPWGGNPRGRAYVAMNRRGCDHVRTDGELNRYDLKDELKLDEVASEEFCKMLNFIFGRLK